MIRLSRNNILIKKVFLYYENIKKEIDEVLAERQSLIESCAGGSYVGGGGKIYGVSKPVESKVEMLNEPISSVTFINSEGLEECLSRPVEWINVVDKTVEYFSHANKVIEELLRERFFMRRSVYISCNKHCIDKNTYYRLIGEGLQFAKEYAIQIGLVKVC